MNVQNVRRTIQFLWDPDKIKENLQRRIERGGSKIYYSKEIIQMKEAMLFILVIIL